MKIRNALSTVAVLLGVGLSALEAANTLPPLEFGPESGVSMKVTSPYDKIPPAGYFPLRVEVKNGTGSPRVWELNTVHNSNYGNLRVSFATELSVDAHGEKTFELLVPLALQGKPPYPYSRLEVSVAGFGVADGSTAMHSHGSGSNVSPFFGMGEEMAVTTWGPLESALKQKGSPILDGTSLDIRLLPSDWRGFVGFDLLFFTAREWWAMTPAVRTAVLDWVALGGRLLLGHEGSGAPAHLPPSGPWGTGTIEAMPTTDLVPLLVKELGGGGESLGQVAATRYSWSWLPAGEIGRLEPPGLLILLFVVVFGITVGPVNFFLFAPGIHRSRLFWTTPLISVAASLLMGLFILIGEGAGGSGRSFVALLTMADQNKTVRWQEQVSRTGVLFGSSFTPSDVTAMLAPIRLNDGPPPAHPMPWQDRNQLYHLRDDRWSGDWFRSRRTQAQLLLAVEPSRGKLVFAGAADGTPTVTSTFDREMTELWYFDASGQPWTAAKVGPGEKVSLTRAAKAEFDPWLARVLKPAGAWTRDRVQGFAKAGLPGKFFASLPEPGRIATLPSIRWKDAGGVVFGRAQP